MTKHLMNMTKKELEAGYEKGKVTDEEIEQHKNELIIYWAKQLEGKRLSLNDLVENAEWLIKKLAEHEYKNSKTMSKLQKFLHESFCVDGETEEMERMGFLVHDQVQGHCLVYKITDSDRGEFYVSILKPETEEK